MKKQVVVMMYVSLAVILSAVETVILPASIIPGIKIGLANIVIIVALYQYGLKEAIIISLFRVIIVSMIVGTFFTPALMISLGGMLFTFIAIALLYKTNKFSPIGVSVASSVSHVIGQILVVIFIIKINSIYVITPFLVYLAVVTGFIVGFLAIRILKALAQRMEVVYEF